MYGDEAGGGGHGDFDGLAGGFGKVDSSVDLRFYTLAALVSRITCTHSLLTVKGMLASVDHPAFTASERASPSREDLSFY